MRLFFRGSNRIRVEGFKLNQFLSHCIKSDIELQNIVKKDDFTLEATVPKDRYEVLKKKKYMNQYRITTIKKMGLPNYRREAMQRKGFAIGLLIFLYLMYYQSLFITEIEVKGQESVDPSIIRTSLAEIGVSEGNKKPKNLDNIREYLYDKCDELAWVGIEYTGNKMVVKIAEKVKAPEIISYDIPCDIIAKKEGYIERIITKYGTSKVREGEFVKEGDLLISGIVQDEVKSSGEPGDIHYIHALGEIYAKIIYRFNITEEKSEIIKNETGRTAYGIRLKIGDLEIETGKTHVVYREFIRGDLDIIKTFYPFPIKLCIIEYSELDVRALNRDESEIKKSISYKISELIEKNIPKDGEIINKDLMYEEERNIIKISVMIESIEQIGKEVKMIPVY